MKKEELNKKLEECNIYIDINDYQSAEELIEYVDDNSLCDEEIIYYSNAIDFLKENDSSLREAIEIASEYGYAVENINSELLASLLASKMNRDSFYEMRDDIEEYFDNLS